MAATPEGGHNAGLRPKIQLPFAKSFKSTKYFSHTTRTGSSRQVCEVAVTSHLTADETEAQCGETVSLTPHSWKAAAPM